ncbi:protein THYLAKOID ASSEMBLY 8-like, chloroplastic [Vicia villosa]|uniref:protein THYLAKOID ASSEMBLY 8-like, chloroplastic n=1 Tax=Vicia villosa TaxID=3911 RepID=UPI00273C4225|nr:protein THYLAKOID ASSEMBLY 8-like, chloroplastic [Vicia villosa]
MILRATGSIFRTTVLFPTPISSNNNRIDYSHFLNNRRRTKATSVVCGLRSYQKRKPPSMVISKESVSVIHALKLAKNSDEKLNQVLKSKLLRLLKADVLDVLAELQRQNQLHLSLKVFEFIIGDEEDRCDDTLVLSLYSDMILLLGKNKMVEMAEEMFDRVVEKGLKPDTRLFNEMIGVYLQVGNKEKAMEVFGTMKGLGSWCLPDELTFTILIRSLMKNGENELVESLKKESFDYVNAPGKFVQKVQQIHAKRRVNLVV